MMIFYQKNNVPCFSREYVGYRKHREGKNVGSRIRETRLIWTDVNYPTAKYTVLAKGAKETSYYATDNNARANIVATNDANNNDRYELDEYVRTLT